MNTFLGQTETEIGSVIFQMNGSNFEIQTPKLNFPVRDIKEIDGKYYYEIPQGFSGSDDAQYIEIPAYILERKEEALQEYEAEKNSIGSIETTKGKVYFYLTAEGKVKAKLGEKEEVTDNFYTVEGQRCLFLAGLGLDIPFVVIPKNVEMEYGKAKRDKEQKGKHLVYAGQSLITGKHYYKFSCNVSRDTLNRVKGQFVFFEAGDVGSLEGWLTDEPELTEEYLRLRNKISSRKDEIDKQKAAAIKENEKLIKSLAKV